MTVAKFYVTPPCGWPHDPWRLAGPMIVANFPKSGPMIVATGTGRTKRCGNRGSRRWSRTEPSASRCRFVGFRSDAGIKTGSASARARRSRTHLVRGVQRERPGPPRCVRQTFCHPRRGSWTHLSVGLPVRHRRRVDHRRCSPSSPLTSMDAGPRLRVRRRRIQGESGCLRRTDERFRRTTELSAASRQRVGRSDRCRHVGLGRHFMEAPHIDRAVRDVRAGFYANGCRDPKLWPYFGADRRSTGLRDPSSGSR